MHYNKRITIFILQWLFYDNSKRVKFNEKLLSDLIDKNNKDFMNLKGKFMKKCLKHFPYEFKKLTNFYLNRTFYLTFTISV